MTPFPPTIETPRLILRQPCVEMAEAMANFRPIVDKDKPDDPGFGVPYETVEDALASARHYGKHLGNLVFRYFYTTKEQPDKILGEITIITLIKETELFWQADKDAPRVGYCSEAARAATDMAANQIDKKVVAQILHSNIRSQAVAERLGMIKLPGLNGIVEHSSKWVFAPKHSPFDAPNAFAV